uniref:Uncharacterized protein n=1 Tax=Romanomermis culicivorax TaxID=13658 RepID=A0A915L165_ROMCU
MFKTADGAVKVKKANIIVTTMTVIFRSVSLVLVLPPETLPMRFTSRRSWCKCKMSQQLNTSIRKNGTTTTMNGAALSIVAWKI